MSEPRIHLEEIKQQIHELHQDGHCSDDPGLYLQVTLMERNLDRAFQGLTIFQTGDKNEPTTS
jgi:hypothetical protein